MARTYADKSTEWVEGAFHACRLLATAPSITGRGLEVVKEQAFIYLDELKERGVIMAGRDPREVVDAG